MPGSRTSTLAASGEALLYSRASGSSRSMRSRCDAFESRVLARMAATEPA